MTPPTPPDDSSSPLATLRQLKEMLDAGAITPQEFEALKQRLVFGAGPGADAPPTPAVPTAAAVPPTPYLDDAAALTPEATPLLAPEPDWLAAPALPPLPPDEEPADEYDDAPPAERRNPLNLVFAIGGLLLFLGVMAYLAWGRAHVPDEHLTTLSQTAADTAAVVPETGPQVEQLTLPPAAAPETIRVAPAAPRPAAAPLPADSAATATTTPAPRAATPPRPADPPAPKAAPKPATAPPADTAASRP